MYIVNKDAEKIRTNSIIRTHCIHVHIECVYDVHIVNGIRLSECAGTFGPRREKTCLRRVANNTGADQPAHPRSLISAVVFHFLESITSTLTSSEISTFWLVSVAGETGLKLALTETPKTGFLATLPICLCCSHSTTLCCLVLRTNCKF